jgi:Ser/Thr protein kinase RdoA (MazF antagonist)
VAASETNETLGWHVLSWLTEVERCPPNDEALADEEVDELHAIVSRLEAEEQQLDALGLPFSIQHDDLHDPNIFIRNGEYRIIDWGDPCVANPLLSLTIALGALAYQLGVDRDAPDVARVRDEYLEPFTALCPHEVLLAAMEMTIRVGHACGTIKWSEVIRAIPSGSRSPYDEGIPKRLRRLLELCA